MAQKLLKQTPNDEKFSLKRAAISLAATVLVVIVLSTTDINIEGLVVISITGAFFTFLFGCPARNAASLASDDSNMMDCHLPPTFDDGTHEGLIHKGLDNTPSSMDRWN